MLTAQSVGSVIGPHGGKGDSGYDPPVLFLLALLEFHVKRRPMSISVMPASQWLPAAELCERPWVPTPTCICLTKHATIPPDTSSFLTPENHRLHRAGGSAALTYDRLVALEGRAFGSGDTDPGPIPNTGIAAAEAALKAATCSPSLLGFDVARELGRLARRAAEIRE